MEVIKDKNEEKQDKKPKVSDFKKEKKKQKTLRKEKRDN